MNRNRLNPYTATPSAPNGHRTRVRFLTTPELLRLMPPRPVPRGRTFGREMGHKILAAVLTPLHGWQGSFRSRGAILPAPDRRKKASGMYTAAASVASFRLFFYRSPRNACLPF